MIYFLILFLIILFLISFFLEKDLFCPPCILILVYIFSLFLVLFKQTDWGITLSDTTMWIIGLGTFAFCLIYLVTRVIIISSSKKKMVSKELDYEYIKVNDKKINIILIVEFIICILYIFFFFRTIGGEIFTNFGDMMHYYRLNTAYGEGLEESIPTIINQLKKVNWAAAYISLYILIYNQILAKAKNDKKKIDIKYIFSIILYLPLTILSGARFDLIIFVISAIFMWLIIQAKIKKNEFFKFKNFAKIFCFFIIVLLIFSMSRTIVGRYNESSFFDYISVYFGAPIVNLDQYIIGNISDNYMIFGREIFRGIYDLIEKFGLIELEELSRIFVVVNGNSLGNVYTAYKYMCTAGWGYFGIVVFQTLLAIVYAKFYSIIKYDNNLSKINYKLIFYTVAIYAIVLHPFSEFFFSTIISFNYILFFVIVLVLRKFLIKEKV